MGMHLFPSRELSLHLYTNIIIMAVAAAVIITTQSCANHSVYNSDDQHANTPLHKQEEQLEMMLPFIPTASLPILWRIIG